MNVRMECLEELQVELNLLKGKFQMTPHIWEVSFHIAMGALGGIGTFLSGAVPFYLSMKKKLKEKKDNEPKFVETKDFKAVQQTIQNEMANLGRIVNLAAIEASNSCERVKTLADNTEKKLEANAKELRDTLVAFKMGVDTSLSIAHQNCEEQQLKVATFDGRLQGIEKRIERLGA